MKAIKDVFLQDNIFYLRKMTKKCNNENENQNKTKKKKKI